jgi:2-polyprenyl-6-methoxyphenol hydroxylase-like FAD-dependent oxidoreductase
MGIAHKVLIVGGGIAGQTLGTALTKRGIDCRIVELKSEFNILGAGMYVHGNGLRALDDIGVVPEIVRRGWYREDDRTVIADMNGTPLAYPKVPRIAAPDVPATVTIQRRILHDILQEAVVRAKVPVAMGTTVESIIDDPARERVLVEFSDGTADDYDLVVGADGVHSKVRSLIFGALESTFSGFSNWRVIFPKPEELDQVVWMYGNETSVGLIPLTETSMYFAGVTKEPGNPWYERKDLPRLMREKFADYGGMAPGFLDQVKDPEQVVYTPIEQVLLPPPWHKGRVVVLGDAAHASTPFWAQGASMAIEDCILLANLLAGDGKIPEILEVWMRRRVDRCMFVQKGSMEAGERIHRPAAETEPVSAEVLAARIQADIDARFGRLGEPI